MRVRALLRKAPSIALVTAKEFCFSTPRIDMQRWVASMTTATPSGEIFSRIVSRDLVRQPLLDLQAPAEHIDEPRNLAQADHAGTGNVGDVALAEKRQQVVLAQAVEVDVLDDHHLAVVDGEQGIVEHGVDVRVVPARQKPERLLDPYRRPDQPLSIRVFAELHEEPRDEIFHMFIVQTLKSQVSRLKAHVSDRP